MWDALRDMADFFEANKELHGIAQAEMAERDIDISNLEWRVCEAAIAWREESAQYLNHAIEAAKEGHSAVNIVEKGGALLVAMELMKAVDALIATRE